MYWRIKIKTKKIINRTKKAKIHQSLKEVFRNNFIHTKLFRIKSIRLYSKIVL